MKRLMTVVLLAPLALALPIRAADRTPSAQSGYGADDTGRNVRDRAAGARTAGAQSNDATDLRITREIRQAVVKDDALSTNAHNVTIVTVGRVVTLRGPVNSAEERAKIDAKARAVAGVKQVDNQLEVATK